MMCQDVWIAMGHTGLHTCHTYRAFAAFLTSANMTAADLLALTLSPDIVANLLKNHIFKDFRKISTILGLWRLGLVDYNVSGIHSML